MSSRVERALEIARKLAARELTPAYGAAEIMAMVHDAEEAASASMADRITASLRSAERAA